MAESCMYLGIVEMNGYLAIGNSSLGKGGRGMENGEEYKNSQYQISVSCEVTKPVRGEYHGFLTAEVSKSLE
jgi:hypothetical protein